MANQKPVRSGAVDTTIINLSGDLDQSLSRYSPVDTFTIPGFHDFDDDSDGEDAQLISSDDETDSEIKFIKNECVEQNVDTSYLKASNDVLGKTCTRSEILKKPPDENEAENASSFIPLSAVVPESCEPCCSKRLDSGDLSNSKRLKTDVRRLNDAIEEVITIDSDSDDSIVEEPPHVSNNISAKRSVPMTVEHEELSPVATSSRHITAAYSQNVPVARTCTRSDIEKIAKRLKLAENAVENVVTMLVDDCTVPFISRYRQNNLHGLTNDQVRDISETYDELARCKKRLNEIEKQLKKQLIWNESVAQVFNECLTVREVEKLNLIYGKEDYLAAKAKNVKLDVSAKAILEGERLDPFDYVRIDCFGLENVEAVQTGWRAIITDIIAKDPEVMNCVTNLLQECVPDIEIEINSTRVDELEAQHRSELIQKYKRFDNFKDKINKVNTQTVFLINRGEREGLLRVFIVFDEVVENRLHEFCETKWPRCPPALLRSAVYSAWDNFLKANFAQYIRWDLTNEAHKVALKVFRDNVKYLLLEPPVLGKMVMGVDPGYDNGCKIAIVSPWGVPLTTDLIYLTTEQSKKEAAKKLKNLMKTYECDFIALGNGAGCRAFLSFLIDLVKNMYFAPLNVVYRIVPESGISYFSVTKEAAEEFPELNSKMISAVCIARRVQNPLGELVKMDPKRLQVGMYMRDIPDEKVREVFEEVVCECVSFVGIDANTASPTLLSKVSGLGKDVAKRIYDHRQKNGPFISRQHLEKIDGVTWKQYEQCAGFVKILPETSKVGGHEEAFPVDFNFLDSTIIHPESYHVARKLLKYVGATLDEIGTPKIVGCLKSVIEDYDIRELAVFCNSDPDTIAFIIDAFKKPRNHDLRLDNARPLYKTKVKDFADIKKGMHLRGRVINVTPIGVFIDVGLDGRNKQAYMPPLNTEGTDLAPGKTVLVRVIYVDQVEERFRVRLKKIIE